MSFRLLTPEQVAGVIPMDEGATFPLPVSVWIPSVVSEHRAASLLLDVAMRVPGLVAELRPLSRGRHRHQDEHAQDCDGSSATNPDRSSIPPAPSARRSLKPSGTFLPGLSVR